MQKIKNVEKLENLISGYLKGELSSGEIKDLIDWIKISDANKQYFDEYCELWVTSKASLKSTYYNYHTGFWKFRKKIEEENKNSDDRNKIKLFKKIMRYAALFLLIFSLSGLLFYYLGKNQSSNPQISYSVLTVPLGSHAYFSLSDGTEVTLNAGSRLKYDSRFGMEDRIVSLEGEGYFKVAKDSKKTFIVMTSCLNIRALGTEFNIKAYPVDNTIETTLIEGSIKVEHKSEKYKTEDIILQPSQKLTFFKNDSSYMDITAEKEEKTADNAKPLEKQKINAIPRVVKENVNVEPVISWKEDRWIFEKQPLVQIAVELERKFDVQIHFNSEKLKSYRFTGIIIAEPIEQVLEVMSISAPINFRLKGKVVTLYENKNYQEIKNSLYKR
ncbi:MAG TPA: FecR family protein [Bacteroidales bacterium]|nr:FecR family protein [Bacteroidales bacterium]